MTHLVETTLADARLNVRHQINPEGYLRAVERSLLDDTLGTIGNISGDDIIGLISRITQEVTLKHGLRPTERTLYQLTVCRQDGFKLLGIVQTRRCRMNHGVVLAYLRAVIKLKNLSKRIFKFVFHL